MVDQKLKLMCLIWPDDEPNEHIVQVNIDNDDTVAALKDLIKNKHSDSLHDIDAYNLVLWKCSIPVDNNLQGTLNTICFDGTDTRLVRLAPVSRISKYFVTYLPKEAIHVLVEVPGLDQRPLKRARLGSPVSEQEHQKDEALSNMINFHLKIWNKQDADENVFEATTIVRGDSPSNIGIPNKCWVMRSPPYTAASRHLSGILIRNEYIQAVKDIYEFYKGGDFALNVDIPEKDDDMANIFKEGDDTTDTAMQGDNPDEKVDTSMDASVDMAEFSGDPVAFPITIPNLFLNADFPLKLMRSDVIITGTPGIGKSLLLEFILYLRSLAGLTTVFLHEKDMADLFTSTTITRLHRSQINSFMLPSNTWVLFDSNRELIDVLEWVVRLDRFIVQAASPRPPRMEWEKKTMNVSRYYLKPWSVEEALAARMLHKQVSLTEMELETCYRRYSPSACTAFSSTSTLSEYESYLHGEICKLSVQQIITMMNKLPSMAATDDLPHHIFILRPGRTRFIPLINFATKYLSDKVLAQLGPELANATQELFEVFNHNMLTRSPAGHLLESACKGLFSQSGSWKIHPMDQLKRLGSKNYIWKIKASSSYKDEYLVVGHPDHPPVFISNTAPAKNTSFVEVDICDLPMTDLVKLVTAYYLPASQNEATFDAFYYDANLQHATVLQFTTSKFHLVKTKGLEWLKELGVKSICYVAATGWQSEFTLAIPIKYNDFVVKKYHLIVERVRYF